MGDLAAITRAKSGPYDVGIIRLELMLNMAERAIEELRDRSEQLAPTDRITQEEAPSETDMS